mmetsp:Transcript_90871/g.261834  ORF Transcript_90871/g.261834 Transcript_90871/m.261834 type:complete len:362 (-) Transcript_90871:236-1321(-)
MQLDQRQVAGIENRNRTLVGGRIKQNGNQIARVLMRHIGCRDEIGFRQIHAVGLPTRRDGPCRCVDLDELVKPLRRGRVGSNRVPEAVVAAHLVQGVEGGVIKIQRLFEVRLAGNVVAICRHQAAEHRVEDAVPMDARLVELVAEVRVQIVPGGCHDINDHLSCVRFEAVPKVVVDETVPSALHDSRLVRPSIHDHPQVVLTLVQVLQQARIVVGRVPWHEGVQFGDDILLGHTWAVAVLDELLLWQLRRADLLRLHVALPRPQQGDADVLRKRRALRAAVVLDEALAGGGVARRVRIQDGGVHFDSVGQGLQCSGVDTPPQSCVDCEPQLALDRQQVYRRVGEANVLAQLGPCAGAEEQA